MHENIPLIFTYHNTPLSNGKVIKMFSDINIEQAFVQHLIREIKFCSLITQSKYFANNALHLGVPKNLIRCCYPGPDTETFFPEARNSNLRKKMGIDSKEILIVIPSRITPRKSIETIVEATNLLKKLPIKVVISSGGFIQPGFESYYEKILDLIKQYHLSQQILLPKCQFNVTQLGELYASADIGVLSSTVEGLGLGILEMMQCGIPMICSNTEGITEIITHKVNGILFPVENPDQLAKSIELLVKKPLIRQKMGMEAKKLVEKKFKLSNYINFHDKIYKEVIKKNIL